jgi:hypothetical protein
MPERTESRQGYPNWHVRRNVNFWGKLDRVCAPNDGQQPIDGGLTIPKEESRNRFKVVYVMRFRACLGCPHGRMTTISDAAGEGPCKQEWLCDIRRRPEDVGDASGVVISL